jgi:RimJ/RimL family protein N-acetyltransferase
MPELNHRGTIRKLSALDADMFAAHLRRLDGDSRRKRFQGVVGEAFLERHAHGALASGALVYGYFDEGALRAAAELHADGPHAAEAAFSVERAWQDKGIGTELFRRLTVAARNRRVRRITLRCLPENRTMQRLCDKFGSRMTTEAGETTARLTAGAPSVFSLFAEALADGTGLAKTLLDARLALLRG